MSYLLPPTTVPNAGDVLFYAPAGKRDALGNLVSWATKSPVCHVEVAIDHYVSLGAHVNGIVPSSIVLAPKDTHLVAIGRLKAPDFLEGALMWAGQQRGHSYDPFSILSILLRLTGTGLVISWANAWTCSEFAGTFLDMANDPLVSSWLDKLASNGMENVTPGDLYTMFRGLDKMDAVTDPGEGTP